MPLKAYTFYLESKYKHELLRDTYLTDMLRFSAFGMVDEKNRPPRYWDVINPVCGRPGKAAKVEEYGEQDVIDMFRGEGKLSSRW